MERTCIPCSQLQVQQKKNHSQQLPQKSQALDHLPMPELWPSGWEVKTGKA